MTTLTFLQGGPTMLGGPGWRQVWSRTTGESAGEIMVLNGHAIGGGVHDPEGRFSIKWVPRGRAVYRVDGVSHHLSGSRTVILNAQQAYELEFPDTFGTQTLCVFFSDNLLREAMTPLGAEETVSDLPEFPDIAFRPELPVAAELERLHRGFEADDPTATTGEEQLLSLLQATVEAARGHAGAMSKIGALKRSTRQLLLARLERARELLHDDTPDFSLDVLATYSGLSKFHLLRLFKAAYGVSPGAYARRQRIRRAQDLLARSALTCSAIAEAVGYDSDVAFLRAFRRETGLTPTAWRAARN